MTTTAVKERPILCSAHEVRAILEGRKTQMRRVVKPQYPEFVGKTLTHWEFLEPGTRHFLPFPYGNPGDRLWVRETFVEYGEDGGQALYRADPMYDGMPDFAWKWQPSIHMPRWASRITLEITGVRVERLQEISAADCLEEGIQLPVPTGCDAEGHARPEGFDSWDKAKQEQWFKGTARAIYFARCADADNHVKAYRELWESINGKGSWDVNPWVWVLEFKQVAAHDAKENADGK